MFDELGTVTVRALGHGFVKIAVLGSYYDLKGKLGIHVSSSLPVGLATMLRQSVLLAQTNF